MENHNQSRNSKQSHQHSSGSSNMDPSDQNNRNSTHHMRSPESYNSNFQEEGKEDEIQHHNTYNEQSKKYNNNKFDMSELKKNPEMYQKILDEAILREQESTKPRSYLLEFRIHYKTLFGERLVIVGSEEFLGDWDPYKGLELEWAPGNFWNVSIPIAEGELPSFEYKYVCLKRSHAVWEGGENRVLRIEDGIKKGSTLVFNRADFWQK